MDMIFNRLTLPNKCDVQGCRNGTEYELIINRMGIYTTIHLCENCAQRLSAIICAGLTEAEKKSA